MDFNIKQLIKITGAKILKAKDRAKTDKKALCFGISTDTRTIDRTKIFIPIIGEKFDGHDFIKSALNKGCKAYFTQKDIVYKEADYVLQVENTLEAYLKIAKFYKNTIKPKTIAITGSAGKTTTKEMAYAVFSQKYRTHKSLLNHNNEIGLVQTILSMPSNTEVLIVEMGMRGLGEIELLSKYAEPDTAIITNIGTAHIGRLGSQKNIAKAKFEITKYLKPNGILIAHKDKYLEKINDIKERTIEFSLSSKDLKITALTADYSEFEYKGYLYKVNLSGEYNIQNAISVIEAGLNYGIEEKLIKKGLEEFQPIQNRWQVENILNASIINDSYNANPESMFETIKNFISVYDGRKILVLGDMGELGSKEVEYHKKLGEKLRDYTYDIMITVGDLSRHISDIDTSRSIHYMTIDGCFHYLKNNIRKDDKILIKASRAMELEKIIEKLKTFEEKTK